MKYLILQIDNRVNFELIKLKLDSFVIETEKYLSVKNLKLINSFKNKQPIVMYKFSLEL